ncbi:AAA family ATPase [Arthrobacter sp. YD2]|uniref:LuxR C-terminal-related transcriptional regulator n=1 Tax=Arthrobacter sp. YD2 TaxID=3058046 RepID=UPI0025B2FDAF|nr:AAA family ATPase [Arthrobacter sp. YD2]MDN3905274.1 LuxR C-terminal-related transcriptional regulator [Arthrobacter sp. YD2]
MKNASNVADLVGRAATLDKLCESLTAGGAGAIILGRAGVGKTAFLRAAADRLQADFHIVYLRGSAISAQTPYGALSVLISELPESVADNPLRLLQELSRSLAAKARGLRVLLAVDNADRLDRSTCMVLSQLLRRGSIAVLAAASLRWEAGDELLDLWSEGLLERLELEALSERQTRDLMQQMLGGTVSSLAAGTMWREGEGSPRYIRLMTGQQVLSGTLVNRGGVWVRTAPFIPTGDISEVVDTVLDRLDARERRFVEILALCAGMPMDTALDLVPASVIDLLEEQQVIEVGGRGPRVVLAAGTGASIIAESMAPGRKRHLWEEVSSLMDPAAMEPAELVSYVSWTMACGELPAPDDARRAAYEANNNADGRSALRFARAVPSDVRGQELVLEELRALYALGDLEEAVRVFQGIEQRLDPARRSSYVPLLLLHARALSRLPGAGDPAPVLAAIEATRPEAGDTADHEAAAVLVKASLAAYRGNPGGVHTELAQLAADRRLSPSTRIQVRVLQANTLALSGQLHEALEIVEGLGAPLEYPVTARSSEEVCTRIFDTYLLAGELERAAEFVRAFDEAGIRPSYHGSAGELAQALLAVWKGQRAAAAEALAGGVGQLAVHDPRDMMPLARTLTAWIHRQQGQNSAEAGEPAESHRPKFLPDSFRRFQISYFSILAGDLERETCCRLLRTEAIQSEGEGNTAYALHFLAAALRFGDREAAAAILRLHRDTHGRFGTLLREYAAGLLQADPDRLTAAARGLGGLGQHQLCLAAARTAAELLSAGTAEEDRRLARTARDLANSSLRRMEHAGGQRETLAELSEFEADLAHRAVTMATTSQIARELNLSPRTIEWHLGKIFAKLHVSGRAELAEVLA